MEGLLAEAEAARTSATKVEKVDFISGRDESEIGAETRGYCANAGSEC